MALAESLGSFSGALNNLARVDMALEGKNKEKEGVALQNEMSSLTLAQRREVARTGVLPSGAKLSDGPPGLLKAAGRADGASFAQELRTMMTDEFNWETGDIDAWLTEKQNEYIEGAGLHDDFARRGFFDEMEKVRSWAISEQERYTAEKLQDYTNSVVFKNLETSVYEMLEGGMTSDELPRHVRALYKDLGKDGTLGMGYDQLDKYVIGIAKNIAAKHPEHALSLIDQPRDGAGPASGPLSDKLSFRNDVDTIRSIATKAIGERELSQEQVRVHRNNSARIIEGNDFTRFEDVEVVSPTTGAKHTITAKDQEETFVQRLMEWGEGIKKEQGVSQEVADREVMNVLMKMGIKHPVIEKELSGVHTRFDIGTQQDPQHMADIKARVDRYRDMSGVSRHYVDSHLTEDDKEFYGTVDTLIRVRQMPTEEAIRVAQNVVDPADPALSQAFNRWRGDIEDVVKDAFDTRTRALGIRWGWGSTTNSDNFNMGLAAARTETYARRLYATGEFTIDRAIQLAADEVARSTPQYRGAIINGLEKFPMHENWNDGLDYIMERFEEMAIPDENREGLTIRHVDGGRLVVTDMDGIVVTDKDGNVLSTNVYEVNDAANKVLRGRADEATRKAIEKQNRRAKQRQEREAASQQRDSFHPAVRPAPHRRGIHDDITDR